MVELVDINTNDSDSTKYRRMFPDYTVHKVSIKRHKMDEKPPILRYT